MRRYIQWCACAGHSVCRRHSNQARRNAATAHRARRRSEGDGDSVRGWSRWPAGIAVRFFEVGQGQFPDPQSAAFADQGFTVLVVDAPSDRQSDPFLAGFRQRPEHAADIKAVIAWAREQNKAPVWLVGTSRGTQSAAFVAIELDKSEGPDGLVLTSTILRDDKGRPVPDMPLGKLRIPVLVVHHEQDGCRLCAFRETPALMSKLSGAPRKQLLPFTGGEDRGDPCEAAGYHGFNGLEREVVAQMARWIQAK